MATIEGMQIGRITQLTGPRPGLPDGKATVVPLTGESMAIAELARLFPEWESALDSALTPQA